MSTDDYYTLIGVSPDADRDTIRDAYRERRGQAKDDGVRSRLNRAWNVLSDPTQRARYDDQLATARAGGVDGGDGDEVVVPEVVGRANGRARAGGRGRARAAARPPARRVAAQETEVNGVPLATNRDRIMALLLDGFIAMLLLIVGAQFLALRVAESQKPEVVDKVNAYSDQLKSLKDQVDAAKKRKTDATSAAAKRTFDQQQRAAQARYDAKLEQQQKEQAKLTGIVNGTLVAAGVAALAVFAIPTALTGRSPGKALRKIRLVRDDGVTPVGWTGALTHYGAVLGFIVIAGVTLRLYAQLAWIVAVWGVSSFARHPKRQGWDNRISKTVVVQG